MSIAAAEGDTSATLNAGASRAVFVRVTVLFLAGMAIAFSAALHSQTSFDRWMTAAVLIALAGAHLTEWIAGRKSGNVIALLLAGASLLAAVGVALTEGVVSYAVCVAAWALISGVCEFVGAAVRPGSRPDAALMGFFGLALSVATLLVREDAVAVLGFLGAYAVLSGVFLGISAFDRRAPRAAESAAQNLG